MKYASHFGTISKSESHLGLDGTNKHGFHFKHLRCNLEVCPELMSRNQRTAQRGWLILIPHEDKVDIISPINIFSSLKPRLVLWFRTCISRPLQGNLSHGSGVNLGCQNQQKTKTFGSSTKNPLRPRTWSTRTPTSLCFSGHLNLDHLDPQPHFLICCPHWKTSELEFPWPQRWLPHLGSANPRRDQSSSRSRSARAMGPLSGCSVVSEAPDKEAPSKTSS